ncbi:MAG: NTP transferase domain-containing protein [bacterium]|nr:NTP transferase domain-containing protein [bacterium]
MHAVILAGGKGTRLHPYTNDVPKPLVPLGETPIIEVLLRQMQRSGVTTVDVAVNHLAHLIMAVLGDGKSLGLTVNYSVEDKPLSTVAPIKLIKDLPEHFIVANGDILTDLDVRKLYEYHLQKKGGMTIATYIRTEKIDFGVLDSTAEGRVVQFAEKPNLQFAVSMGVYVFSREILKYVPDDQPFGFDELVLTLLAHDEPIMQYPFDGFWLDIGRTDDYQRALTELDRIKSWLR